MRSLKAFLICSYRDTAAIRALFTRITISKSSSVSCWNPWNPWNPCDHLVLMRSKKPRKKNMENWNSTDFSALEEVGCNFSCRQASPTVMRTRAKLRGSLLHLLESNMTGPCDGVCLPQKVVRSGLGSQNFTSDVASCQFLKGIHTMCLLNDLPTIWATLRARSMQPTDVYSKCTIWVKLVESIMYEKMWLLLNEQYSKFAERQYNYSIQFPQLRSAFGQYI